MARPFKGDEFYRDKHIGCRILKYPLADMLSEVGKENAKTLGSICNIVVKERLAKEESFILMPNAASIILAKATPNNPKKSFTLYLTDEEQIKLTATAKTAGISQNRLVNAFLVDYLVSCGIEI